MNELFEAALGYALRGWTVFPVDLRKRPLTEHGFKDATIDTARIANWWTRHPAAGIASPVPVGAFVLDVDPRHGGDESLQSLIRQHGPLPPTVTTRTGGGGRHLRFRLPPDSNGARLRGSIGAGLDVKAGGAGYVLLPPSPHKSGQPYTFAPYCDPESQDVAEAPPWLVAMVSEDRSRESEAASVISVKILNGVPEGERDNSIFRYACSLRARWTTRPEAEALVLVAARACIPPFPDEEALRKIEQAWRFPAGDGRSTAPPAGAPAVAAITPTPDPAGGGTKSGTAKSGMARTRMLSEVRPQKVEWYWRPRIARGTITLFDGDPKRGKSTLLLDLVARASRCREFPDGQPGPDEPMRTLLLSAEDPAEFVLRPRFDQMGGDPDLVMLLDSVRRPSGEEDTFSFDADLPLLEDCARAFRPDLVIVDPLTAYLGGVDSWKDQSVRRVLAPVARLAVQLGFAFAGVRHLNKRANVENVLYRGGGSIGFAAAARSVLFAFLDPDTEEEGNDQLLLAHAENNLARKAPTLRYRIVGSPRDPDVATVEWLGTDPRSAQQIHGAAGESQEQRSARGDARGFLRELLGGGQEQEAKHIFAEAAEAGITKATLRRAEKDLRVAKRKEGFEGGKWTWTLPKK